jgi:hypothetical protein
VERSEHSAIGELSRLRHDQAARHQ